MTRSDDGAVDHVGSSVSGHQLGQGFQHGVEHTGLDPTPVSLKDAVPLPILAWQTPPMRARSRDPQHTPE